VNKLVWFRADLRASDNTALHDAATAAKTGGGAVVGVFNIAPDRWLEHDWAPIRVNFLLRTLGQLSADLAKLNIPLKVVSTKSWDTLPTKLVELARDTGCDAIYANDEYEWNERLRDDAVAEAAEDAGLAFHRFTDQVLYTPGSILTGSDKFYTVYSPFKKNIYKRFKAGDRPNAASTPKKQSALDIDADAVPDQVHHFDADRDDPERYPAGEKAAQSILAAFIEDRSRTYDVDRDNPSITGTSTLSHHLAIGSISPRQCLHAALDANGGSIDTGNDGLVTWISELLWRDFYKHLLIGHPRVCMHQPFKPETDRITWNDDDALFEAWTKGRTGFPIVDAGMRQLNETGWMHNRVRMIVAMFFTKDLFLDWRRGERYFMRNLIDGDLASNNGGWQWSASTGTDAAPYFRIFNPTSQSTRYDPKGEYIRRWLPELEGVQGKVIHEPSKAGLFRSLDYPAPIVDHGKARDHAIASFKALSG